MTQVEYLRLTWKQGYREMTKEELEFKADVCRTMSNYEPNDTWWKESLELIEEVLKEKSYAQQETIEEE